MAGAPVGLQAGAIMGRRVCGVGLQGVPILEWRRPDFVACLHL
jgi:hypothetical protein